MTKQLSEISEDQIIKLISTIFAGDLPADVIGIGDDCAVIPDHANHCILMSTDCLIENVHFIRDHISPESLGEKSLAVNISDIAAKGGEPHLALLTLALPSDLNTDWVEKFLLGFHKIAQKFNVRLVGGDTNRSPQSIFINITIIGKAMRDHVKLRSQAKPHDVICVTSNLGDSHGGLKLILDKKPVTTNEERFLIHQHYHPRPHVKEGQLLSRFAGVHAIMDVSDGINSDLKKIMAASEVGATIHIDKLPISNELNSVAKKHSWNSREVAALGGEDYCLLVCVDAESFKETKMRFENEFGSPLIEIGHITKDQNLKYLDHGKETSLSSRGFKHFS